MRLSKQVHTWDWICKRQVDGMKCNGGKFSIQKGTFFEKSKLSIQSILRIIWNFINHLSEEQYMQYVGISIKANHAVSEFIVVAEISVTLGLRILHILQSLVGLELL